MTLSLAVILGAGITFPSILGIPAVSTVTFSENPNKIWFLVYYIAFYLPAWYGGALLFLKHAQPTQVNISSREVLLVSALLGVHLLLMVTTNVYLAVSIAYGFFLFLHCYFGKSTTTPTYAKRLPPVFYLLSTLGMFTMGLGKITSQEQLYNLGVLIFALASLYFFIVLIYLLARDRPLDKEQNENNPLIRQNAHYFVLLCWFIANGGGFMIAALERTHEFGAVTQSMVLQVLSILFLECAQSFSLRASDTTRFAR